MFLYIQYSRPPRWIKIIFYSITTSLHLHGDQSPYFDSFKMNWLTLDPSLTIRWCIWTSSNCAATNRKNPTLKNHVRAIQAAAKHRQEAWRAWNHISEELTRMNRFEMPLSCSTRNSSRTSQPLPSVSLHYAVMHSYINPPNDIANANPKLKSTTSSHSRVPIRFRNASWSMKVKVLVWAVARRVPPTLISSVLRSQLQLQR